VTDQAAPDTLLARYSPEDLELLDADERKRFTPDDRWLAWELLYRKEPELYERLVAGERINPRVLDALPDATSVVEVAAGTGRLTSYLASRYERVTAVEPAGPLRERLIARGFANVEVSRGFFDEIPAEDSSADMVVSCAAFTADRAHGGEDGLRELERVASRIVAFVWPADVDWLCERGFTYERFDGEMAVEFESIDEAVELAQIFYPDAVGEIIARNSASVPYEVLGTNPPTDWAWKLLS
jgi:SAM-dependent methyltransferase